MDWRFKQASAKRIGRAKGELQSLPAKVYEYNKDITDRVDKLILGLEELGVKIKEME